MTAKEIPVVEIKLLSRSLKKVRLEVILRGERFIHTLEHELEVGDTLSIFDGQDEDSPDIECRYIGMG